MKKRNTNRIGSRFPMFVMILLFWVQIIWMAIGKLDWLTFIVFGLYSLNAYGMSYQFYGGIKSKEDKIKIWKFFIFVEMIVVIPAIIILLLWRI